MAHELEVVNGKASMFYKGATPWHGLGTKVDGNLSVVEALKAAGLDWDVQLIPLFAQIGDRMEQVTHRAIVRSTDNKVLSCVGPAYTPLQNRDALGWFQPFLDAGECHFETAGSLREGRRIWALALLNRDPIKITSEDVVNKYLLLSNSHDSQIAARVGFTPVRVVCANTLAMAEGARESKLIRVMHTGKIKENLESIRDVINAADRCFEATAAQYRRLVTKGIHTGDIERFVNLVWYEGKLDVKDLMREDNTEDQRQRLAFENLTNQITELFEHGLGNDLKGVKGSYWALYNAGTEYINYLYGKTQDTRLDNLWFGSSAQTNKRAMEVAFAMATDTMSNIKWAKGGV
jgi:phage/plasmid-like protein (TIGR03299 family)